MKKILLIKNDWYIGFGCHHILLVYDAETPQPNKINIEHRKTHTAARACQYAAATAPRTVHLTQVRGWFLGGTCNSVQEQCATLDFLIYSVSARATILSEPQTTRTNPLNT